MARFVVLPTGVQTVCIKCRSCRALYVPDSLESINSAKFRFAFERCPVCGCESNDWDDVIPVWKYNLIRFFRGVANDEGRTDEA